MILGLRCAAPMAEETAQKACILDEPEAAETALLALLTAKTDSLCDPASTGEVRKYAKHWLKLVGDELRDEVGEGFLKRHLVGLECTVTVLGRVADSNDSHWLTVKTKESIDEDENPDPPMMHMLLLAAEGAPVCRWLLLLLPPQSLRK
mgnify:CR=1 FL=1